jgi:integral membrane protein
MNAATDPLGSLRLWSRAEGFSLLALVLVAMPLKYMLHLPLAVRITGGVHGLLFLVLLVALVRAIWESGLLWRTALQVLALALLPFGFLLADGVMVRAAAARGATARD